MVPPAAGKRHARPLYDASQRKQEPRPQTPRPRTESPASHPVPKQKTGQAHDDGGRSSGGRSPRAPEPPRAWSRAIPDAAQVNAVAAGLVCIGLSSWAAPHSPPML